MKLKEKGIKVGVSNKHIHLSRKDLDILFGDGYELTPIKDLGQPGQYAADEVVDIVGPKGTIPRVRVLGPVRKDTQLEVSKTDAFKLGVNPPVRDSGDISGSEGIKIVGPKGEVEIKEGVILAKRHIHMHTDDAAFYNLKDKDIVSVLSKTDGRNLIFQDVLIRVSDKYALEFHVDTDEANAALLRNNDLIYIIEEF
ncbi:phosphate propanoyltransferase [Oceanotoga sp. DSM 15011]|uniref:Phosphate propanoyltransferase n=1 Tax=Oceanotoga teriensis TaxID=515440 RepID=A0AA45HJL7_9BACT|nr:MULTISPECIES: phosphate propanoyltransferase [Oceanotoga]MDN5342469.1 putative phosphotransacetylase [Oceanotoga sp.]MDO7975578.1 phosphate propanoyltransferase [Oceanotoga teriensis]PWJ96133.1 putative phosphotransacetylase [Oceanotoga teriensis]UYO99916.1 phosphate propanoyltransferase [Oceanotoga sp. DSM 15011]